MPAIWTRQLENTLIVGMFTLLALACGDPDSRQSDTIQPPSAPSETSSSENIQVLLASTDISVGSNRIVFGLMDIQEGMLREVDIEVSTFYLAEQGPSEPKETLDAVFRQWPS